MDKPKMGLIIGTTRPGRFSEHVVAWIKEIAETHQDIELEVLDLRDFPFSFFNEATSPSNMNGKYADPIVARWAEKIKALDGFIAITAEYNHAPSAVLKNAFDVIANEWSEKPIAFIGYGSVGGARAIEHLRQIAVEFEMAPVRNAVHIMSPWFLREQDGSLKAGVLDSYKDAANNMLTQLTWWTKTLKAGRGAK